VNQLPVGKLPAPLLRKFLGKANNKDAQVVVGPAVGEDAAAIRLNDPLIVAGTDPSTFATDLIGWYAVNVNANDVAAMGISPRWFLATVLLPERCRKTEAEAIFEQIHSACSSLAVTLVGGHTEITYGLKRPIVVGCMLGEAAEGAIISTSGARPGDDIVLTKGIAIEGTALLAREAEPTLISSGLGRDFIKRAAAYLFTPGISVLKEAMVAASQVKVHSMHDPTEGGLAGGFWEIAEAAKVGLLIEENKIPVLPECRDLCDRFGLNPLGLLASGSLIITLDSGEAVKLLRALDGSGITAEIVGKVVSAAEGCKIHNSGGTKRLPRFGRDELARFLENCS
jgi:hydrogenase maturation factor